MEEAAYYFVKFIYQKRELFFVWITDDEDLFLLEDGELKCFFDLDELYLYCKNNDIPIQEGFTDYDMDELFCVLRERKFAKNCALLLNFWNIFSDLAQSVGKKFCGDDKEYSYIYQKLFFGNNLRAINKGRKNYIPVFEKHEKNQIMKVLEEGIKIFEEQLEIKRSSYSKELIAKNNWKDYKKILCVIKKYYLIGSTFGAKSKEYKAYKKAIKDSKPNRKRQKEYYKLLSSLFPKYFIKQWEDPTSPSFRYTILLHKNQEILDDDMELLNALNGKRFDLEIFISKISDYFYTYTTETLYDGTEWKFDTYSSTYLLKKKHLKKLKQEFEKKGLRFLDRELAHMEVPFVETELLPQHNHSVEVFNCLFSDRVMDNW